MKLSVRKRESESERSNPTSPRNKMYQVKLSIVIPARDVNDPKLKNLIQSIDKQDFPKDEIETLVITEGTSESAKAIGIRRAKGEVIGILSSDNYISHPEFLRTMYESIAYSNVTGAYPAHYSWNPEDTLLNRYFAFLGGNDPLAYYMNKNDRECLADYDGVTCEQVFDFEKSIPTLGDNGFFVRRASILLSDLENYFHIDACEDLRRKGLCLYRRHRTNIFHLTGDNLLTFFKKRYRYGLQYAFNKNRRWHLVDFSKPKDIVRLIWFIFAALTLIQPLFLSIRGYLKIRDVAWFLHWPICLATLFTYGILVVDLGIKQLSQLLFAPMAVQKA